MDKEQIKARFFGHIGCSCVASFPLKAFLSHNKGLRCRERCGGCNKKFPDTGTLEVHLAVKPIEKNGKTVGVNHYLCTGCVEKSQSNTE